jgi:hypothetical protein
MVLHCCVKLVYCVKLVMILGECNFVCYPYTVIRRKNARRFRSCLLPVPRYNLFTERFTRARVQEILKVTNPLGGVKRINCQT